MWKMIWGFVRKITFSDVRFGLNVAKSLLGSTKNMGIINKLNTATDIVDKINRVMSNDSTNKLVEEINNNERTFKGFTATVAPDKHGAGNNGLVLGYSEKGGLEASVGFKF